MHGNVVMRAIFFRLFILALLVSLTACGNSNSGGNTSTSLAQLAAFPGAEGFGANATGGRGGRVIKVTNLNDSGSGSLRAAVEASGPRIVIFTVGGRINLDSEIEITEGNLTIAGQTAPGGGIELANASSTSTPFDIQADNVIIRNMRIRPGPGGEVESVLIRFAKNIIIDHCSFSWTTDESFDTYIETFDLTLQRSIISESLDCSTHSSPCHGAGLLIGSRNAGRMTFHHNLLAHHSQRNPRVGAIGGVLDFVNNVVYNWGATTPSLLLKKPDVTGTIRINYVGNYYKAGPDSTIAGIVATESASEVYIADNVSPGSFVEAGSTGSIVSTRHLAPALASETSAAQAYNDVLASAGANMRLDCNGELFYDRGDGHDARAVSDVENGTGSIIDDPSEVGGYQPIAQGTPCSDLDDDGMPDAFEDRYSLNKNSAIDANQDSDSDGYLNIEEYLNGTSPQ